MCGIFSIINYINSSNIIGNKTTEIIKTEFSKGKGRGPESSELIFNYLADYIQGFHRLAINGLTSHSNQPLNYDNCSLICNGEIYNYKELYKMMNITPTTESDCEVIIHLYLSFGIEHTLRMLDGVFAFVLFTPNNIYVSRDPYGVRPLYFISPNYEKTSTFGFTSELKTSCNIANLLETKVKQFPPGFYMHINKFSPTHLWTILSLNAYHKPSFSHNILNVYHNDNNNNDNDSIQKQLLQKYVEGIQLNLINAVKKRYLATERPIACLLSGGLDSSLIAAIVCDINSNTPGKKPIETYSIGLPDSEDIKYARIVADHIGSTHTEIIITEQDMLDAIPEVIKAIESYDVTTVRASIGNYLLGKYISTHSQAKVIFNGDGSDELCGGYLYMKSCPNSIEYDKEIIRLLKDIHLFDVLRSDKSISSHGLEPRTPFLDKGFVDYYLSIPLQFRDHNRDHHIEKYLLRMAFLESNLLPEQILWRKKEAFSDGVSKKGRSLFEIIQDHVEQLLNEPVSNSVKKIELEKKYYKDIFNQLYPGHEHLLPYYWMPKYIESDDPSARTLSSYSE